MDAYIKSVKSEIQGIRNHATEEEKARLDFDTFDPDYKHRCIYGQMTGWCFNERALELKKLAQVPQSKIDGEYLSDLELYIIKYAENNKSILSYIKGTRNTMPHLPAWE